MRLFGRESSKPGAAPGLLAPRIFPMPDRKGRRGEMLSLYGEEPRLHVPGVFFGFALVAAVVLASFALKWAFVALHIPIPMR